ncbi:hypothetical protein ALQ07_101579 [Pseudomonas syringae pv. actinidiae]|uniref:Uncharacterized protein n=1 Tax=Pseudomonas syringae pv. actinidiae TaxID=103796 RepID=A0A3M4KWR8_PSESF|nr:hypothetical protein ALQ07_101579 [Pseudomonas syringae pv. actinidiae]
MGASGGYDGCDGLRSGPKTGRLGCIWYTEAAGFAAGSRQFADKRRVARSLGLRLKSKADVCTTTSATHSSKQPALGAHLHDLLTQPATGLGLIGVLAPDHIKAETRQVGW